MAGSIHYPHTDIERVARSTRVRGESVRENAQQMRGTSLPGDAPGLLGEATAGRSNSVIDAMAAASTRRQRGCRATPKL